MSYIPPLIFSALSLLDPAITAFLSWMLGLEKLPTIFSWLGGLIVILGVATIYYGEQRHGKDAKSSTLSKNTNEESQDGSIELTSLEL